MAVEGHGQYFLQTMETLKVFVRNKRWCALLLPAITLTCGLAAPASGQTAKLPVTWKLAIGDNPEWAGVEFNDTLWTATDIGTIWRSETGNDTVYAWYRVTIIVPSAMKASIEDGNGMELRLGKIDDVDQTFINGGMIGQTGGFPPMYETQWDSDRIYVVPPEVIRYDTSNVIAVRVFSHIGGVGMYEGPYTYGPVEIADVIKLDQTISPFPGNSFTSALRITNNGRKTYDGTIEYSVRSGSDRELHTETMPFRIQRGSENVVRFDAYQPQKADFLKIGYRFIELGSNKSVMGGQMYLANRDIELPVGSEPEPAVKEKVVLAYSSVPPKNQHLRGYLHDRLRQNLEKRLLKIEEQEFLAPYLRRPGRQAWIGEHVGKYLDAATHTWRSTHDVRLKKQMDRIVYTLINTQLGDGYLGTYLPGKYWTSWDVWSHKYNLYGLLAYYAATGYRPALETSKRIGDLLSTTFGHGRRDIILAGEHVGMAATSVLDPMLELYRYTGDRKYLDFCVYIVDAWRQSHGPKIIHTLLETGQVNRVANGKAYELLSNLVGLVKLYAFTGDSTYLTPVLIAWNDVVANRLYVTGTTSSREYFKGDHVLPGAPADNVGEGCVTVTWLQLNHLLLSVTGTPVFADQMEKTIYNHLLAAENPVDGWVSVYTPLMGKKPFVKSISCCQSSIPRGIAMIPSFTFGNVHDTVTVLMYEPAEYQDTVSTRDNGKVKLTVKVQGKYPEGGEVVLLVNPSRRASFPIALRVPSWCTSFQARVKGKTFTGKPDEYLVITRAWKSHDWVRISMGMPLQPLPGGATYPDRIAFQRGPQVLAFDRSLNAARWGEEALPRCNLHASTIAYQPRRLPRTWIGTQSYSVTVERNEPGSPKRRIALVPYADASQTGGEVQVWLPFDIVR